MSFDRTLTSLNGSAWALAEDQAPAVQDLMRAEARGDDVRQRLAALGAGERAATRTQESTIAVIPVAGLITQRIDWLGTSCRYISAALQRALADPTCAGIVLAVDSPGGTVSGVPELADEIFAARSRKPIVSFVDPLAASAAFWIASQANEVVMTPSGQAGSIGVFLLHLDLSGALEKAGVRATFVKAGPHKTGGNPFEPPAPSWLKHQQAQIDECYGDFLAAVARGRGVSIAKVRDDFGGGRCFQAREAMKAGMVDRIGTLPDAAARVMARRKPSGSSARRLARHLGDAAQSDRARRLAELSREPAGTRQAKLKRRLTLERFR